MILNKIIEVRNDGKNGALFNAFLSLVSIEAQVNKALGDKDEDFPIGGYSNVWLSPNPDPGILLQDVDRVAEMSIQAHINGIYIYAFEYHNGTLLFGPHNEVSLIIRLNQIKDILYSGFGKAYLEKLESQVTVNASPYRYNIDMYVGGGWSIREFVLEGLNTLCSVTMSHENGDSRQIGLDLGKEIFLSDTPVIIHDIIRIPLIEQINKIRHKLSLELQTNNKEKTTTECGAV